jgi:hypothetical protein
MNFDLSTTLIAGSNRKVFEEAIFVAKCIAARPLGACFNLNSSLGKDYCETLLRQL